MIAASPSAPVTCIVVFIVFSEEWCSLTTVACAYVDRNRQQTNRRPNCYFHQQFGTIPEQRMNRLSDQRTRLVEKPPQGATTCHAAGWAATRSSGMTSENSVPTGPAGSTEILQPFTATSERVSARPTLERTGARGSPSLPTPSRKTTKRSPGSTPAAP